MLTRYLRSEDAIAYFKRALEMDAPHPMTVFLRLAHLLSTVGDSVGAAGYAQAAVTQGETHAQPVEYYAKALVTAADFQVKQPGGEWARAREYLERVTGQPPGAVDEPTITKAKEVLQMGGGRLEWSVLKWNEPSIKFYERIGAKAMTEWQVMRVDGEGLKSLAERAG